MREPREAIVVWIAALVCLGSLTAWAGRPVCYCPPTAQAPSLDGVLDDACWRPGPQMGDFPVLIATLGERGTPARQPTFVYLAHDDANLYVGLRCWSDHMADIKADTTEHDSYGDDCVEIFLDTNRDEQTYCQLVVNASGTRFDSRGFSKAWNAPWDAVVKRGRWSWTAEARIPFASVEPGRRHAGVWGANFVRSYHTKSKIREYSGWCRIDKSFHEPRNFGWLQFGGPLAGLDGSATAPIHRIRREAERLVVRCRQDDARLRPLLRDPILAKSAKPARDALRAEMDTLVGAFRARSGMGAPDWVDLYVALRGLSERYHKLLWRVKIEDLMRKPSS